MSHQSAGRDPTETRAGRWVEKAADNIFQIALMASGTIRDERANNRDVDINESIRVCASGLWSSANSNARERIKIVSDRIDKY